MPLVSYAPNKEDVFLWHALNQPLAGRFIAISSANTDSTGPAKCDAYSLLVTRSFFERGWGGIFLTCKTEDADLGSDAKLIHGTTALCRNNLSKHIQDELTLSARVNSNDKFNPLILVLDSITSLKLAFKELDWEGLKPSIVLVHSSSGSSASSKTGTSRELDLEVDWQYQVLQQGFILSYQIEESYFFVSTQQPEVAARLNDIGSCLSYITQEFLDLRIAYQEQILQINLISEQLEQSRSHASILRAELTRAEDQLNAISHEFYLLQRRPSALLSQIKRVIANRAKTLFIKPITAKNQAPKS